MADKKLIDNASSTTVDNFYGNKGGADVQIPLATAASVLAGVGFLSTGIRAKDILTSNDDANNLGAGVYIITDGNKPANYVSEAYNSILISIKGNADRECQIILSMFYSGIWYRSTLEKNAWEEWKKLAFAE